MLFPIIICSRFFLVKCLKKEHLSALYYKRGYFLYFQVKKAIFYTHLPDAAFRPSRHEGVSLIQNYTVEIFLLP